MGRAPAARSRRALARALAGGYFAPMPKKSPSTETPDPAQGGEDLSALDFEAALEELETLVDRMEAGDLSLEASLAAFERGVRLTRHCQAALRDAELKVKRLTDDNTLETLDPDDVDDD